MNREMSLASNSQLIIIIIGRRDVNWYRICTEEETPLLEDTTILGVLDRYYGGNELGITRELQFRGTLGSSV